MKLLILYTTKYGSVFTGAKKLNEFLQEKAEIIKLSEFDISTLNSYDIIIFGASIYFGNIQEDMEKFIKNNISILQTKKIFLFLMCAETPPEDSEKVINAVYPPEISKISRGNAILGSAMDLKKMNFFEKMIVKMLKNKDSYIHMNNESIQFLAKKINSSYSS